MKRTISLCILRVLLWLFLGYCLLSIFSIFAVHTRWGDLAVLGPDGKVIGHVIQSDRTKDYCGMFIFLSIATFFMLWVTSYVTKDKPSAPNQALEPTSTAVTPPAIAGDRASGTRGSP